MNPFKRPKRRVQESAEPETTGPAESDLIAYARAHVTSPGARALLDEVERGRVRSQSAHARLPVALMGSAISTMDFGRTYYTLPWAMWADADSRMWLHPDYPTDTTPHGTFSMRIELREDGYRVWPVKGGTYRPEVDPGYVGTPSQPFIPVAAIVGLDDENGEDLA